MIKTETLRKWISSLMADVRIRQRNACCTAEQLDWARVYTDINNAYQNMPINDKWDKSHVRSSESKD